MKIKLSILATLLLASFGAFAQAGVESVFQKELLSKNEKITTIKSDFVQTRAMSVLASTVNKKGVFYFVKPSDMLLAFSVAAKSSTVLRLKQ